MKEQITEPLFDLSLAMINERLMYENDVLRFPGHVLQIESNGEQLTVLANLHQFNQESGELVSKAVKSETGRVFVLSDVIQGANQATYMKLNIREVPLTETAKCISHKFAATMNDQLYTWKASL